MKAMHQNALMVWLLCLRVQARIFIVVYLNAFGLEKVAWKRWPGTLAYTCSSHVPSTNAVKTEAPKDQICMLSLTYTCMSHTYIHMVHIPCAKEILLYAWFPPR